MMKRNCPNCKKDMKCDVGLQQEANDLMKSWGASPFKHIDWFCYDCGIRVSTTMNGKKTSMGIDLKKLREHGIEDLDV